MVTSFGRAARRNTGNPAHGWARLHRWYYTARIRLHVQADLFIEVGFFVCKLPKLLQLTVEHVAGDLHQSLIEVVERLFTLVG